MIVIRLKVVVSLLLREQGTLNKIGQINVDGKIKSMEAL